LKVAIIGGCGFIGSHVKDLLVKKGYSVRIIGRCTHSSLYRNQILGSAELVQSDIRNFHLLEKAIINCDAVMHYAALIHVDESIQHPQKYFDVNVFGTMNVLEICKKHKLPLFFKSTSEVYGNIPEPSKANEDYPLHPRSPYAVSKMCAERYCLAYYYTFNLPVIVSRGFNTYGPRQKFGKKGAVIARFIRNVLLNEPPQIYGDGLQTRDFIYVSDLVEGDVKIFEALVDKDLRGEIFNVSFGKDYSIKYLAEKIISLCRKDIQPIYLPARPGEVRRQVGDNSKMMRYFGWKPKVSLEEGLKETIRFYQDELDEFKI